MKTVIQVVQVELCKYYVRRRYGLNFPFLGYWVEYRDNDRPQWNSLRAWKYFNSYADAHKFAEERLREINTIANSKLPKVIRELKSDA